jgi:tetratricopeptide (TPR) repeat protein
MVMWLYAAILAMSIAPPAPLVPAMLPMPRPEQILAVPSELRVQLRKQVIGPGGSGKARLQRLVDFMFKKPGLGMEYQADATSTVEQAYRTRKANCLTFTLLTVALAREVGLDAYGQEVDQVLDWHVANGIIYRFSHVNAGINVGNMRYTIDVASDSVLARHPPKAIRDQRLLALYYNNRVAEMIDDAPSAAAPYMAMALQLDPDYASGWANAGVLHLLKGDTRGAERDYLKALAIEPTHVGALLNLVTLYRRNGDEASSAIFERRLEKVQKKDPYYHFLQARDDEQQGDYAGAVQHYRRAIRLYDGDSRFYLGLARSYQKLGEERHARRATSHANALIRARADSDDRAVASGTRN